MSAISYAYTFGGRTNLIENDTKIPGPGNYQIQGTLEKKNAASFGVAKRGGLDNRELTKVPGPGTYALKEKLSGPRFG